MFVCLSATFYNNWLKNLFHVVQDIDTITMELEHHYNVNYVMNAFLTGHQRHPSSSCTFNHLASPPSPKKVWSIT